MKQEIVPTSPQSSERKLHEMKKIQQAQKNVFRMVLISILGSIFFGAIAGFFGFIMVTNVSPSTPFIGKLSLYSSFFPSQQTLFFSRKDSEQTFMTQAPTMAKQMVVVFSDAPTMEHAVKRIGNAVILTADGWMVMPTSVLQIQAQETNATVSEVVVRMAIVLPNGAVTHGQYSLDDPLTGMTFFKVESSAQLSVVQFGESKISVVGETQFIMQKDMNAFTIFERHIAGIVHDTETPPTRFTAALEQQPMVDIEMSKYQVGSPVFYSSGAFGGIMIENGVIVPDWYIHGALESIITSNAIHRSHVDIAYVNVSYLTKEERKKRALPEQGIFIISIAQNSSTELLQTENDTLQKNDVILSINNTLVDPQTDLSTVIHSKPEGTVLYLTIMRNGQEYAIQFTT
ncbi:MAG TPA: S1C family serine protease [Patescibacteria group bacterium]|nr:S1C family serine protease [Patescibacteria group bacterium]